MEVGEVVGRVGTGPGRSGKARHTRQHERRNGSSERAFDCLTPESVVERDLDKAAEGKRNARRLCQC
ncbi:unnamed protein product (mitochondrion) [Plasmodiophora brassicae]|uniref:Uncharacterized protein n=1 Tax=Plasmodiophora brassicae TaxID=37360 RepID=A0A3P3Y825_PLABS|nr:unnamed protein product [Plasmodiophora brassicae]